MSEADAYRLRPVRDARVRDERAKRGELAGAVGDARTTEAHLARAAEHVRQAQTALETARSAHAAVTNATSAALVRGEEFLARRRAELARAHDEQVRAQAAHAGQLAMVDTARARLARARADREVLERHFAQWRTERRKLAERRED